MNSIYIKYTYIALYLGRALFSLVLKMKCCCLCLWFNHPAPSWLNFASAVREEQALREGSRPPPPPRGCGRRQPGSGGAWFCSDSVVSGSGRGGRADTRLVRFVLLLFDIVSMPGRGESFSLPK
uniref:Uncharacterized protein n=1 Tax=Pipistrellus kuhlii TaxID=59472 RepID=A0A7J7ZJ80_PIPKU|nr:hypothetical protein mPipKuh1_009377 [Pipistrellus kuhlii]